MTPSEIARLEKYLRDTFQNENLNIRGRPSKEDSAEVYLGEEFIAVIFKDEEDGDLSYAFQMTILEMDLPVAANVGSEKG
jgi:hypothetical protein